MEGQTANPWLIMAINMTVVFAVLILLGVLMEIIHMIDPTKKKKVESAAPVAAAPVAAAPTTVATTNDEKVVAAIVGAVVAMGYSSEQIASIRPTATSAQWRLDGRLSGRN
ncbi:OadG family protein [Veillonella sp.]|uniref:methylmalonyl-CoA decarboxylase subunit delta n=1 Tax=Veillonella sp. TaxID=1926307 RepID=UPI001B5E210B|nr:OadG family protein [Veillonella sp.]MBP8616085.1 OadG family protein [Veillonella sp.]